MKCVIIWKIQIACYRSLLILQSMRRGGAQIMQRIQTAYLSPGLLMQQLLSSSGRLCSWLYSPNHDWSAVQQPHLSNAHWVSPARSCERLLYLNHLPAPPPTQSQAEEMKEAPSLHGSAQLGGYSGYEHHCFLPGPGQCPDPTGLLDLISHPGQSRRILYGWEGCNWYVIMLNLDNIYLGYNNPRSSQQYSF